MWEWISTLAFLRTYLPPGQGIWDSLLPIGHLCSLKVEEHSDIIMSLIALAMVRKFNIGILLILRIVVASYYSWRPTRVNFISPGAASLYGQPLVGCAVGGEARTGI